MNVRKRIGQCASYAVLIFCSAAMIAPIVMMVVGSLTPSERVMQRSSSWSGLFSPDKTLDHYTDVLTDEDANFGRAMLNSLLITGTIVACGLAVNGMAGYAFARMRWRGRALLFTCVLALMILPFETIAIPLFYQMTEMGWRNSYHVQIVPFIANAFSIYLFYTYFLDIPRELEEAAEIDGAGPWRIFWTIIVPNAKPAFATVAILTFLVQWGSFLWPLMMVSRAEYRPLPVAIEFFYGLKPVNWGTILAFGVMMVAPVLIVFLLFQKWFVRGIAASGIKA